MLMGKLESCRDVVTEYLYALVLWKWYIYINSFLRMFQEVKCTLGLHISKYFVFISEDRVACKEQILLNLS